MAGGAAAGHAQRPGRQRAQPVRRVAAAADARAAVPRVERVAAPAPTPWAGCCPIFWLSTTGYRKVRPKACGIHTRPPRPRPAPGHGVLIERSWGLPQGIELVATGATVVLQSATASAIRDWTVRLAAPVVATDLDGRRSKTAAAGFGRFLLRRAGRPIERLVQRELFGVASSRHRPLGDSHRSRFPCPQQTFAAVTPAALRRGNR